MKRSPQQGMSVDSLGQWELVRLRFRRHKLAVVSLYALGAMYLIAIFLQKFGVLPDGRKVKHYYPTESTGIATGILITALHHAGLATLTHTPSPMKFLNDILGRPRSERPFLLLVTGYPADDARVPDIDRKPLADFTTYLEE